VAEASTYIFEFREVVEALIKKQGLHEGTWALYVEFALNAANAPAQPSGDVHPVAIVPVMKVGLQRVPAGAKMPGALDAAVVNPEKTS